MSVTATLRESVAQSMSIEATDQRSSIEGESLGQTKDHKSVTIDPQADVQAVFAA